MVFVSNEGVATRINEHIVELCHQGVRRHGPSLDLSFFGDEVTGLTGQVGIGDIPYPKAGVKIALMEYLVHGRMERVEIGMMQVVGSEVPPLLDKS